MGQDDGQASDMTEEGLDILGDRWRVSTLLPWAWKEAGAVASIVAASDGHAGTVAVTSGDASRIVAVLIAGMGPDAGREVLAKLAPWPFDGETPLETTARLMREKNAAEALVEAAEASAGHAFVEADALRARAERAEKRLDAVLETPAEDIARALWPDAPNKSAVGEYFKPEATRILDLIRSRATDGAERRGDDVDCSYCGASKSTPCRDMRGKSVGALLSNHPERIKASKVIATSPIVGETVGFRYIDRDSRTVAVVTIEIACDGHRAVDIESHVFAVYPRQSGMFFTFGEVANVDHLRAVANRATEGAEAPMGATT